MQSRGNATFSSTTNIYRKIGAKNKTQGKWRKRYALEMELKFYSLTKGINKHRKLLLPVKPCTKGGLNLYEHWSIFYVRLIFDVDCSTSRNGNMCMHSASTHKYDSQAFWLIQKHERSRKPIDLSCLRDAYSALNETFVSICVLNTHGIRSLTRSCVCARVFFFVALFLYICMRL